MDKKRRLSGISTIIILIMLMLTGVACQTATPEPTDVIVTQEQIEVAKTEQPVEKPFVKGVEGTPLYGGTLVVISNEDLINCNPASTTQISWLPGNVFDGLARYNANFELQPELAVSWDISEDGLGITFHLREGVKWHDGAPFTSADVKFTWESSLIPLHHRGKLANAVVESIETPDDYSVIFHLKNQSPGFLYQIGIGESMIIPKHIYENEDINDGPQATCETLPIGTGPFKAADYERGVKFTMERNDEWWGTAGNYYGKGQPYLDRVIVTPISDASARIIGFEKGEFDFLPYTLIPSNEITRFQNMGGRDVTFECTGVHVQTFLAFNLRRSDAPYADLRVRQAMAWALDLDMFNERVYYGHGVPSSTFLPPNHPEYNPNLQLYRPRNIEKAKALLDEAGYPPDNHGIRFEMTVNADSRTVNSDPALIFAQQMEEIGIKVTPVINERNIHVDLVYIQHDFDSVMAQLGVFDPAVGVACFFRSDNIGEAHFNNAGAYVNPEMDSLWDIYGSSYDREERLEVIYRIQEILLEDLPVLHVNTPTNWMSYNTEEFAGFQKDCLNMYALLRTIWWQGGSASQ